MTLEEDMKLPEGSLPTPAFALTWIFFVRELGSSGKAGLPS